MITTPKKIIFTLWCLAMLGYIQCSVLVPTYVLAPASFGQRDQRSLQGVQGVRTLARLAGGHLRINSQNFTRKNPNDAIKNSADYAKNSFAFIDKEPKNYDDKFAGVVVKTENHNIGWNQGQWDDGMLMSSAGNGKEKSKQKLTDDDEDKKTLADQVAEGKYGLIQKELFAQPPNRPGLLSYAINPETKTKDNESSLGGLKNDEIWLAEDHLLVLKGGSYADHDVKPSDSSTPWPPIDNYEAPPRQVKIPQNPEVPPPFPVRLSDNGPLVFLTPNGSIPAPLFPFRPPGASFSPFSAAPYPYPPPAATPPQSIYPRNFTAGRTPFPIAPFSFIPPRNESEPPFPILGPINASFPGGLPPGASFLPPPGNLSDLYDEDDPSIYYPPPYSFSYQADNSSKVPAGPLVPGIILPPPPDFFAPLEPTTPKIITTSVLPTISKIRTNSIKYKPSIEETLPNLPNASENTIDKSSMKNLPKTTSSRPVNKTPNKVVILAKPITTKTTPVISPSKPYKITEKIPITVRKQVKTTLKPVNNALPELYYPDKNYYEENSVSQSPRPFIIYGPPEGSSINQYTSDKSHINSTPVPLRAFYSNSNYENVLPKLQFTNQNPMTITRIRPDFIQNTRQNGKSVASFYFYEEPTTKISTPTPAPETVDYYNGGNYYQTVNGNGQILQNDLVYNNKPVDNSYTQSGNLDFRPLPSREPSPFFFVPQRQGSRTLTQEYFSVQKPKPQNNYIQQTILQQPARPESFYEQIASIQQAIDYYTTHRPKINIYQQNPYREARQKLKPTPKPIYQFSFQSNNIRPDQNTFRAPEIDSEPFRPMVTYSKPYNIEKNFGTTPKNILPIDTAKDVKEIKYYTTSKPIDYDYEDSNREKKPTKFPNKSLVTLKPDQIVPGPKIKKVKLSNPTTKSPVDHAYYTKQEEILFDDITKNYFNIFGQKIESSDTESGSIAVTTPIRPIEISTISPTVDNRINNQYSKDNSPPSSIIQQPIISLASDTQVNYRQPRPLINPDSEFIPIVNPEIQAKYNAEQEIKRFKDQGVNKQKVHNVEIIKSEPYTLDIEGQEFGKDQIDIVRPIIPSHYIQQIQPVVNNRYNKNLNRGRHQVAEGRPGSLITYRLPGDGAHVYFLTPQPTRQEYRTAEEISALS